MEPCVELDVVIAVEMLASLKTTLAEEADTRLGSEIKFHPACRGIVIKFAFTENTELSGPIVLPDESVAVTVMVYWPNSKSDALNTKVLLSGVAVLDSISASTPFPDKDIADRFTTFGKPTVINGVLLEISLP